MCRLLAYLGPPISPGCLLYDPPHSLEVQSYQPREMEVALLNADGFGLSWYHPTRSEPPFLYRSIQPMWHDLNLPHLSRYIETGCLLAYVRSATPGLAVDLQNCQPFQAGNLSFIHNGFIERFRQTLYRPMREQLGDRIYQDIQGLTDSEHLFALLLHILDTQPQLSLEQGLSQLLHQVTQLADQFGVRVAANLILSDGQRIVACRYDTTGAAPSLYWLRGHAAFPHAVLLASEPLFDADWVTCPQATLIVIDPTCDLQIFSLDCRSPDQPDPIPVPS